MRMRTQYHSRVAVLAIGAFFTTALLISGHGTPAVGQSSTEAGWGLHTAVLETPHGKIKVNLPDDMATGDVISGTVIAEPSGNTEEEKRANTDQLNGHVVELGQSRTPVLEKAFRWTVPAAMIGGIIPLIFTDDKGDKVGATEIPVDSIPYMEERPTTPTPEDFVLPSVGQEGRPVQVTGPFDGDFVNTRITIGGREIEKLAESPRKLVAQSPRAVTGPTEIEVRERDIAVSGEFRNIAFKLTAPKTTLYRGDQTTLTVEATGLQGLRQPVEVRIENLTPTVISKEGGETETVIIQPEDVQAGSTFTLTRTLTGIQPGNFSIAVATSSIYYGEDPWHLIKDQIVPTEDISEKEAKEELCDWVDEVVNDLKEKKEKLEKDPNAAAEPIASQIANIDRAIENLPACCTTPGQELDWRKKCIDLYLRPITVVKTGAALWSLGFEFYTGAIEAIVSGDFDCDLIEGTLDFLMAMADATGNKNFKKKVKAAKDLCKKVKDGKKALDDLKQAFENLKEDLEKLQEVK